VIYDFVIDFTNLWLIYLIEDGMGKEKGMSVYGTEERVRGMPEELYDEIVEWLKQGVPAREVAEEMGWSLGTIYKIRTENNIRGRLVDPLQGLDTDQIVEDYRVMKNREVMAKHDISHRRLFIILELVGEPTKKNHPEHQAAQARAIDEAMQMYKDGELLWVIEADTGLTQPTIHKHLHLRGVELRRDARIREAKERREA